MQQQPILSDLESCFRGLVLAKLQSIPMKNRVSRNALFTIQDPDDSSEIPLTIFPLNYLLLNIM